MTDSGRSGIFDPGMQPERTALAWRRTALAMGVGSIAALRVFPLAFGAWALIPAGIAVAIAVAVFVLAQLRYRRNHRALTGQRDADAPVVLAGGGMVAIAAVATLGFAAIAAVLLVVSLSR
jgi:putative membrane protein